MPSLKKKIPPPPKEPGTHTNAEVKEALHARALRRTILITAVVFLLLACLAVVSNSSRDAVSATGKPKMVLIVVKGLSPSTVDHAMKSNKAPFTRLLKAVGGAYSSIDASYAGSGNRMVNLLTGSSAETKSTLSGSTSILGWLKAAKKRVVVAAPSSYWSRGTAGANPCGQIGLLDTECSADACPEEKETAYCNAERKYVTCDDRAQLYQDELPTAFQKAINLSADVLYFQSSGIAEAAANDLEASAQERSEVNLLDATVGRIALALSKRSSSTSEQWLLIVTSDGDNAAKAAPLLIAAYSKGEIVQLNSIAADAKTSDVFNTVKMWFEAGDADSSRLLGICTSGAMVKNCKAAT
ncbi:hypothetical protein ABB37_03340 [Leptomonas pyrrhocoris]|uniref:Alkaline phosphatase n=1 Tax=Leptomonas pyrrhocoris TaxID=157538 RepID=A0A0N0DWZ7_LEPPY|nr:hypothetical protein ABB37_03340 [Leptomonas pyrrhocoris]KPA82222.1 hypothetical protein ABB37_03340 [Leptomonas pyrrhocoris]|eukprot:XP_015660661.1 hypothetical protein ABB37_03340 [Leptomonas pyrrhocoris]